MYRNATSAILGSLLTGFLLVSPVMAQQHGPRAGELHKAGDILLEVVARDERSASIHLLEANWGDKDTARYSVTVIASLESKPKPLACERGKFSFTCDLTRFKGASRLLIEVYEDKRKVGVANVTLPLKTVLQMAPPSQE